MITRQEIFGPSGSAPLFSLSADLPKESLSGKFPASIDNCDVTSQTILNHRETLRQITLPGRKLIIVNTIFHKFKKQ